MFAVLVAVPAFAQFAGVEVRPFALATEQRFDASTTFNAVSNAKAHYLASGFNLQLK